MGVVALAFFDPNTSRGPQRLPEFAIGKNANLALEPKRLEILIFFASVTPTTFRFQGGSALWYFLIRGHSGLLITNYLSMNRFVQKLAQKVILCSP
jgi:hypothetical protein